MGYGFGNLKYWTKTFLIRKRYLLHSNFFTKEAGYHNICEILRSEEEAFRQMTEAEKLENFSTEIFG